MKAKDEVRKAKTQLELDLARGTKKNNEVFYRYISQKNKVHKGILSLVSNTDRVVTTDKEKGSIQHFCLHLHWQLLYSQPLSKWFRRCELEGEKVSKKKKNQIHSSLRILRIQKGPSDMHPRVLTEWAGEVAKPF